MTRRFRRLDGEQPQMYPGIGLRLIDDFTGERPSPPISARLEQRDSLGRWVPASAKSVYTPDGVLAFVNLARSAGPDLLPRRFRVILEPSTAYDPAYRRLVNGHDRDALEFVAYASTPDAPPFDYPTSPETDPDYRVLYPSVAYPFPPHVQVLRGVVRDVNTGRMLERAKVAYSTKEEVLTREEGFALPVRWLPRPTATELDVFAGDTRLRVEDIEGFSTVPRVEIISGGQTFERQVSNVDVATREFDIAPPVPAGPGWPQGAQVRPLSFNIDVFYRSRHITREIDLADGFTHAHDISV